MGIPLHSNRDEINHVNRLSKYAKRVQAIYDKAILEFSKEAIHLPIISGKPFSFDSLPKTKKRADNLVKKIVGDVSSTVNYGIYTEWESANKRNDKFVDYFFHKASNKSGQTFLRYKQRNNEALKSFAARRENGLNLSERIWKHAKQFQKEIEVSIDLGISKGKSAASLARDVKKSLVDSDRMLKEFTNKHGVKSLRQITEIANPGQGVYKSATKNAERLTRTETNMSYRNSDYARWQQMDFIVGIEIKRSNRITSCPICSSLVGKYPKGFKFSGWHPQCLCFATPIMMTDEEMDKLEDAILNDEPINFISKNQINNVPPNFTNWINDNKERIDKAISLPYFIKDNKKYLSESRNPIASELPTH